MADFTIDGNGNSGDKSVVPDRWHTLTVWDTPGTASSDFDGGTVHVEAKVDEANGVYVPLRADDGSVRTLSAGGSFEFRTSASVVRVVLSGGGADEDVTGTITKCKGEN